MEASVGASMTGMIEWTHDAQVACEFNTPRGEPRWGDDHLHGVLFETDKEYDFFGAVAGVRGQCKHPLIEPRGVPSGRLSWPASSYFEDFGENLGGWLLLSEVEAAIRHANVQPIEIGFELDVALAFMRMLVARLGDAHVRLVFDIRSA